MRHCEHDAARAQGERRAVRVFRVDGDGVGALDDARDEHARADARGADLRAQVFHEREVALGPREERRGLGVVAAVQARGEVVHERPRAGLREGEAEVVAAGVVAEPREAARAIALRGEPRGGAHAVEGEQLLVARARVHRAREGAAALRIAALRKSAHLRVETQALGALGGRLTDGGVEARVPSSAVVEALFGFAHEARLVVAGQAARVASGDEAHLLEQADERGVLGRGRRQVVRAPGVRHAARAAAERGAADLALELEQTEIVEARAAQCARRGEPGDAAADDDHIVRGTILSDGRGCGPRSGAQRVAARDVGAEQRAVEARGLALALHAAERGDRAGERRAEDRAEPLAPREVHSSAPHSSS